MTINAPAAILLVLYELAGEEQGVPRRRRCLEPEARSANITKDIIPRMATRSQTVGGLVRARRLAHGLTQARLALRAGTTQAAISRIERGEVSPTFATLAGLLAALGEEPAVEARRMIGEPDEAHLTASLARSPEERLELAISWNELAGDVALAGREARRP